MNYRKVATQFFQVICIPYVHSYIYEVHHYNEAIYIYCLSKYTLLPEAIYAYE